MGAVIGELLPLAVGVAVSPIPIIAAILMLLSTHARATSIGFAAGWVIGIVAATVVFVFLGGAVNPDDGPSATSSWIKLVLGLLLLALGVRQWRARNEPHPTPKWMGAIDNMTATTGFGLGFALAAVNPKNLLMCAAAGVTIGSAALETDAVVISIVVFSILAATTVVLPVVAYLLATERLRGPLADLKQWLQAHNAAVMATLVLVIGVALVGKGISGLT